MSSVNRLEKDEALFVADQFLNYCDEKERKKRQQRLAYKEHKKELEAKRREVAGASFVLSAMLALCVAIVFLNMQTMQREEQIALLEERVSAAKKETKEAEKRLAGQADYKWVEREAKKLGMSRVTPDKIYYYTVEDDDFMVQYRDVD
ncbi:MAG: hypothetical protein NC307_06475 [Roseburia sp.]|nr:hypothetical protein [Roseburia sp.]